MQTTNSLSDMPLTVTPADYARALARPPTLSSTKHGWHEASLQRFKVPYFDVKLGASSVHRITLHLEGPVLIDRTRDGRHDRRWSGCGSSNIVPSGVPVTRSFKGQTDFIVIYLSPNLVNDVAMEAFHLEPSHVNLVESFAETDEVLERFARLLLAEAEAGDVSTRLFTDTVSRALSLHLIRAYSPQCRRTPVSTGALIGWRLRRAMDYMNANLAENISLAQLAEAAGLSPSHFARAFRASVGEPPHRHLIRLRIDQARHLLENTRLPVIEIGLRCGFEQTTHFATMFRKITGLSPRAFRAARCTYSKGPHGSGQCSERDVEFN